jgi:TonB-dependent Receptor Plug Domain
VEANPVKVQSDSGEISDVISGQRITQLATNGRSVFELEALTPGASSIQADFQVPTSAGGDFNVSFNGQRVSHNLWLVDGGEAADRGGGGGADVLPSMDAIAEFRTMTSNYSAEYGLSSAGTMPSSRRRQESRLMNLTCILGLAIFTGGRISMTKPNASSSVNW